MLRTTLLVLAILVLPAGASAQVTPPLDTTRVYELEAIVVTADRSASLLASSTAAVSVLREADLERLPIYTLADALEQTPGFTFVNLDGLGFEPQAMVRGFYGGGETEYVVVLVDGRPLNNLESGLVNWNQIPLSGIASVEVLRGGASSLYGDAAIGSVVNIVTKSFQTGSDGAVSTGANTNDGFNANGFWRGGNDTLNGGTVSIPAGSRGGAMDNPPQSSGGSSGGGGPSPQAQRATDNPGVTINVSVNGDVLGVDELDNRIIDSVTRAAARAGAI